MEWTFTGEVIEWRGPAPYLFVAMTPRAGNDERMELRQPDDQIIAVEVVVKGDTAHHPGVRAE